MPLVALTSLVDSLASELNGDGNTGNRLVGSRAVVLLVDDDDDDGDAKRVSVVDSVGVGGAIETPNASAAFSDMASNDAMTASCDFNNAGNNISIFFTCTPAAFRPLTAPLADEVGLLRYVQRNSNPRPSTFVINAVVAVSNLPV